MPLELQPKHLSLWWVVWLYIDGYSGDLISRGSLIQAGNNITLDAADDIQLLSAENHESDNSTNESSSAGIGLTFGGGSLVSVNVSASASRGVVNQSHDQYLETTLTAGNQVEITSGGDTHLEGGQVFGEQITAEVGGDLSIISQQDLAHYSKEQDSWGLNVGIGIGAAPISVSANYSELDANSNYVAVQEQSGLFAGDGGFDVNVGGNTHLEGAAIVSSADADNNQLSTQSLSYNALHNEAYYDIESHSIGFSTAGISSITKGFSGGSASDSGEASNTTFAVISEGNITVADHPDRDLTGLMRDRDQAHTVLEQIFDASKVDTLEEQVELQHMLSAEVPRAIGDYASRQLAESDRLRVAAENEADPARRDALINAANAIQDNWSEGGTYRVALHTLSGALSGNVSGALGSFMAASQIGILDDALSDMNADPTLREAVLLASSFMMGAATNGLQGAINTTGQTANNYLSHAQIDELQSKLTLCNGDKDCQLEAARQYEDISDSNLAQMIADCEQGGPECAAHSSAMQATQDYYRRAIYESSGFSRNVLLSFAVNDLLEQNVPASTVTGKQLEEYGFSPEVVSMAAAIIAGGRRPNSAKPDGAKPTSGGKTDTNSKEEFGVPVDMPSRHKLYDIPGISANRQSHVLDGQVNASGNEATGGHWLGSSNIQPVAGSARSIGNGVISAEVKIRNPATGEFIPKSNNGGRSTLFPPNWDSRKVMSEVTSANSNAVRIGNTNYYDGVSPSGVVVRFVKPNGKDAVTFYPRDPQ